MKQTSFFDLTKDSIFKTQHAFGGSLMKKAKFRTFRPLNKKYPLHLILRSSQAKGPWSFKTAKNYKMIEETLRFCAGKYGVKVSEFSNNGNHLHLLIWITNRTLYIRFIRALTGMIAQKITDGAGSLRGKTKLSVKFWDYRPFTRIVVGWKGYKIARDYVVLNKLESMGVIDYQLERLKSVFRPLLV